MDLAQVWGWKGRGKVSTAALDPVLEHSALENIQLDRLNHTLLFEQKEALGNYVSSSPP